MSLDDSTAPEVADTSGVPSGRSGKTFVLVGLLLVLVLGIIAFFAMREERSEPEAGCISEVVTLTTAPVMEGLVKEAVKDVNTDEPCIDIQVTAGSVNDVVALSDPAAELPDLWIPDSPTWKGQVTSAGETPLTIEEKTVPVAQTYGERAVAGSANQTDLATITASSTQLVPATERAYLAAAAATTSSTRSRPRPVCRCCSTP